MSALAMIIGVSLGNILIGIDFADKLRAIRQTSTGHASALAKSTLAVLVQAIITGSLIIWSPQLNGIDLWVFPPIAFLAGIPISWLLDRRRTN